MIIEGDFAVNEQDPYEPLGILYWEGGIQHDLAEDILVHKFGIKPACEKYPTKKLRVTIEEIE